KDRCCPMYDLEHVWPIRPAKQLNNFGNAGGALVRESGAQSCADGAGVAIFAATGDLSWFSNNDGGSRSVGGRYLYLRETPVSHFEMVLSLIESWSASWRWVRPLARRVSAMKRPILI